MENYDFKIPSLSKRLNLFFENILKIRGGKLNYNELIGSLIYPNCLTLMLGFYLVFNYVSYNLVLANIYKNIFDCRCLHDVIHSPAKVGFCTARLVHRHHHHQPSPRQLPSDAPPIIPNED